MSPDTSNTELLLYVLSRSGGAARQFDLEDLYEECYRLFPSRFGWKAKAYPSDKAGDQAVRDITKSDRLKDLLRLSRDRRTVRLTAEGVAWVREREEEFESLTVSGAPSQARAAQRHLIDLENSEIARQLLAGDQVDLSRARGASLLNLTPDAETRSFRDRLEGWRSDAELSGRQTSLEVLEVLEKSYPDWFGGRR